MKEVLFRKKYRISSIRQKGYDYSAPGCYFITICVKGNYEYMGKLIQLNPNKKVVKLNNIGEIINYMWLCLPTKYFNIDLGDYIVMPNHIHGIIFIKKPTKNYYLLRKLDKKAGGFSGSHNPMFNKSISNIIRWYKSKCSYEIKKYYPTTTFKWLPRFYDHIIRNEIEYKKISEYIINNPNN